MRDAGERRPAHRTPMSPLRKTIADRVTRSWREIPHVTTFGEAMAQPLLDAHRQVSKAPLEALIIHRVLPVLVAHPLFNAVVDGTDIVERSFYDIGFAVDSPQGLLIAVVHDARYSRSTRRRIYRSIGGIATRQSWRDPVRWTQSQPRGVMPRVS